MVDDPVVKLSDAEWMSLIDMEREGLPICCANISNLRDVVIDIAREGGHIPSWRARRYIQAYQWAINSHEGLCDSGPLKTIARVCADSIGVPIPKVGDDDEPASFEVNDLGE